jgi:hypothetical protein
MAALGDIVTQATDVIERCTVSFDDFMILWFWASREKADIEDTSALPLPGNPT